MSNGTASASIGLFAEFAASVVRQLPRDVDKETVLRWIDHQSALKAVLYESLILGEGTRWPTLVSTWIFEVEVDYSLSLKEMIGRGGYDYSDLEEMDRFPLNRRLSGLIEFHLIRFREQDKLSLEDIREKLRKQGLRPAELIELFAFGSQFPNIQKYCAIVALGSHYDNRGNPDDIIVPVLQHDTRPRILGAYRWSTVHLPGARIAAVADNNVG